jgi:hypothetical protein
MPLPGGRGFNWNLDMYASPAIDITCVMINGCGSHQSNFFFILGLVLYTEENGKEFVVSDLLDFSADDPSAFLKDALVVPERIELLQCVG